MVVILAAAVAVLTVLTLVNLVLVLAIIRRLRQPGQSVPAGADLPMVGAAVGPFTARSVDGGSITERAVAGGATLVAFVSPGCDPCAALVDALTAAPDAGVSWLLFVAGPADHERTLAVVARLRGIGPVVVVDETGPEAVAFGGVRGYPTLLRIERGTIAAAGVRLADVAPRRPEAAGAVSR